MAGTRSVPWTTTGRLVPIVRRLSHVAAAAAFGWAAAEFAAPAAGVTPWPIAALSAPVLLLYVSMLVRDAERGHAGAVPLSVLVMLAALVPLEALAARLGWSWPPEVWLAAAGVLLTLRARGGTHAAAGRFWAGHLGGVLPLATFVFLAYGRTWAHNPAAAVVAVFGAVFVLTHWSLRKRRVHPR